jgi:hypothetical protein
MRFFFPGRYADVVERDRGQDGYFGVQPHPSELTNGANLTGYKRNGFGVKKIWLSGLNLAQWLACPAKFFSGLCVKSIFFNGLYVKVSTYGGRPM